MSSLLVTLDTSAFKQMEFIRAALAEVDHDLRVTTVSSRESPLDGRVARLDRPIAERIVLDESSLDVGRLGDVSDADLLEAILLIIDNGFPKPGKREHLSRGHRNQLRDAMILAAHVRDDRHMFVTGDEKAFIRDGRRERHQALRRTRIVLPAEIIEVLGSLDPAAEVSPLPTSRDAR